jgi:aspartate 1-decarboxylase
MQDSFDRSYNRSARVDSRADFDYFERMRWVLRSKIHKATVTEANVDYVGSITIDEDLIDRAGLWYFEKVLVVSNTTGQRLETYVIPGNRGSGVICMNGGAAHLIKAGEEIIVMGFELTDKPIKPANILVDKQNKFVRYL